MKKDRSKASSADTRKQIKLALIASVAEVAASLGLDSKKIAKTISKSSAKLAKKFARSVKSTKTVAISAENVGAAPIVTKNRAAIKNSPKPSASRTVSVKKPKVKQEDAAAAPEV
ncbi:hypothetical protein [Hufsiella ginkgonis]|uniref:Uncharacterized protein n=1 Tax=Hufsiella ginkgonis TaxID=2695274 RepID=A0A7K1Y360_9SPHI|nr:hypothetical protein [Hufsiella ginkgonis]MXV17700.1 hypothetical protein [Hufsiella ginkgonis]